MGIKNPAYDLAIKKMAEENKMEVVDILPDSVEDNDIGPSEFLDLIRNCCYVCTDSFHGSVFSILYEKPFGVFGRPMQEGYGNMSSRISTLLESFDLRERLIQDENIDLKLDVNIDYVKVKGILETRRRESEYFLRNALKISESNSR